MTALRLKAERAGRKVGPFPLFVLLSLAAVALGCWVARQSGTLAGEWSRNLVAWAVGLILAAAVARWAGRRILTIFPFAALAGLGATFLNTGLEGVHRWIQLGPVRMNVAEILLPAAVVAVSARVRPAWFSVAAAALSLALLVAQPDASQATAFGAALAVLAIGSPGRLPLRAGVIAIILAAAVVSWLRRDPLAPVADVEGIMGLAGRLSPLLAVAAWGALLSSALAPLAALRAAKLPAIAFATYAALTALTPLGGAFPVPLVGMGMSPILGLWLGVGLLVAVNRRAAP